MRLEQIDHGDEIPERRRLVDTQWAGLDPAQMALAFVNTRPFLTSTIIGATTMQQLQANIASIDIELSGTVLDGIAKIHTEFPNPSP